MFYNMRNTYVLTHFISASSMGLFYAIHGNHMSTPHTHPQEPRTSMSMRTLCHTIIQHHQQHSFVGFFFFFFFFSRIFMCELFRLILSPLGRDYEHFTTISNIHLLGFFSTIFVCRSFRLALSLLGRDYEHLATFTAHYYGL